MTPTENRTPKWVVSAASFLKDDGARVYTAAELAGLLIQLRDEWRAPRSLTFTRFIDALTGLGCLKRIAIRRLRSDSRLARMGIPSANPTGLDSESSALTRYVCGDPSIYQVALSLRAGAYLSHASALFLNGLTTQAPTTVYVNKEQTPKPSARSLTQAAIDTAFKRAPRVSRDAYRYEAVRFVLLSGKHTDRLGVAELSDRAGGIVPATGLERTLIDAAVRPTYAGGASEVLKAFRAARDRLSVETLVEALGKLRYVYPYNQAIGFYMERAGYSSDQANQLRAHKLRFDFYLEHNMPRASHSSAWRLYYPEGL